MRESKTAWGQPAKPPPWQRPSAHPSHPGMQQEFGGVVLLPTPAIQGSNRNLVVFRLLCFMLLQQREGLVPGKQPCSPTEHQAAHGWTSHTSLPRSLQPGEQLPQTGSLPKLTAPAQQRFLWAVAASEPQGWGHHREMLQWEMRLLRARSWRGREGELAHATVPTTAGSRAVPGVSTWVLSSPVCPHLKIPRV